MEIAIRTTSRARQDGTTNPVGEVVCICPDGHPWTPTERSLFHIVQIPNTAPEWLVDRLRVRALKFRARPGSVAASETAIMAALRTYDDKVVNKLTELGRRAVLAGIRNTDAVIAQMRVGNG